MPGALFLPKGVFPDNFPEIVQSSIAWIGRPDSRWCDAKTLEKPAGQEAGHCTRFDGCFQHKKLQNQKIGSFL
jgi:hypothetical protein